MHEFSICARIVEAVQEELAQRGLAGERLHRVRVVAGALHEIVPDYMATAYEALTRDTPLAASRLDVAVMPVRGTCRACGWTGEIQPPIFQCPACEAFEIDAGSGNELYLERLEVDDA